MESKVTVGVNIVYFLLQRPCSEGEMFSPLLSLMLRCFEIRSSSALRPFPFDHSVCPLSLSLSLCICFSVCSGYREDVCAGGAGPADVPDLRSVSVSAA